MGGKRILKTEPGYIRVTRGVGVPQGWEEGLVGVTQIRSSRGSLPRDPNLSDPGPKLYLEAPSWGP